jgi:hypothetical protein
MPMSLSRSSCVIVGRVGVAVGDADVGDGEAGPVGVAVALPLGVEDGLTVGVAVADADAVGCGERVGRAVGSWTSLSRRGCCAAGSGRACRPGGAGLGAGRARFLCREVGVQLGLRLRELGLGLQ